MWFGYHHGSILQYNVLEITNKDTVFLGEEGYRNKRIKKVVYSGGTRTAEDAEEGEMTVQYYDVR